MIHGSEQNPLRSNMRLAHHHCQTIGPIVCSVKHTQANNKTGCWLLSDLFTRPCSLTDDPQPGSSSCAEAGGWGCCQTVAAMKGGFITLSSKFSSPDWGPSGRKKGCQRGLALKPLTVCLHEIEWVSICLRCTGLCYRGLFRSLTCLGGVRAVQSRISLRNLERAPCNHLD